MQVNSAEIVMSAVSAEQYPNNNLPEIALAGRSNVGKSSFINQMINRKGLARTSSKPGKTRTINFYLINDAFYFVDVPGYGFAKVSAEERNKWAEMMEEYFETRMSLKLAILVVDARHKPTKEDIQMFDYLKYNELDVLIIATKVDKLKKNEKNKRKNEYQSYFNMREEDRIVFFSSETSEGKTKAWSIIDSYLN